MLFEKENQLNGIVMFLMDIKQLDQLKSEQNKRKFLEYDLGRYNSKTFDPEKFEQLKLERNKREFLEYDSERYKSTQFDPKEFEKLKSEMNKKKFLEYDSDRYKQTDPAFRIETTKEGEERKEFLVYLWQLARDNDEILRHESVKQIFNEKWREKAAIKYYFSLLMFIVFVVFYNIYMELDGKSDVNTTFQLSVWYISLIFAVINLMLEVFQCMMHIFRRKFIQYANRYDIKIGSYFLKVN